MSESEAWPIIKTCLEEDCLTLRETVAVLEARGIDPPGADRRYRDGRRPQWTASAVKRIADRRGGGAKPLCAGCRLRDARYESLLSAYKEQGEKLARLARLRGRDRG